MKNILHKLKKIILILFSLVLVGLVAYTSWYSYERQNKITEAKECKSQNENPYHLTKICSTLVPPSIWDLARGNIVVQGIPNLMKLNPYSLKDVLLGNYTVTIDLGPRMTMGSLVYCDQSATTTDCSKLPPQSEPKPYIPPNVEKPTHVFTSATNTSIAVAGYSFILPPDWQIEAYARPATSGWYVLFQKNYQGFSMECPPSGKGFEAATVTEKEQRTFVHDNTEYNLLFESLSQLNSRPWYFLFIQVAQKGSEFHTECLVQGDINPDVTEAMRMFYDTISVE